MSLPNGASQFTLPKPPSLARGSDYAELSRQVRQAGLMERRPWRYAGRIALTVGLLAAGWTAFVLVGNSWWQLAVAVFLAVIFAQLGFLGHDAGHRQVSASRPAGHLLGVLLGKLCIGLSFVSGASKHNRPPAHPNTQDSDPAIALYALAFSPRP